MYTRKYWNILIIDNDADVHELAEKALSGFRIYGVPMQLIHANSAAAARELLMANEDLRLDIAVALIAVAMEGSNDGIDLTRLIRGEMGISSMQIILRTAGTALPDGADELEDCTVCAYTHKAEMSAQRLRIALRSAIMNFYNQRFSAMFAYSLEIVRELSPSPTHALSICQAVFNKLNHDWSDWAVLNMAIELGEQYAGVGYFSERVKYETVRDAWYRRPEDRDKKMAWTGLENWWMEQDSFVVTKTPIPGKGVTAFMMFYEPTMPEGYERYYGPILRMFLQSLAQMALP